MGITSVLRLSPEAKIRLPNVDEALNIGYAIHSADDPALRNKIAQQNAQLVVKQFLALEAEAGSPEEAYLTCVRAIVHSQARGIARRKERYIQDLKAAQLKRRRTGRPGNAVAFTVQNDGRYRNRRPFGELALEDVIGRIARCVAEPMAVGMDDHVDEIRVVEGIRRAGVGGVVEFPIRRP